MFHNIWQQIKPYYKLSNVRGSGIYYLLVLVSGILILNLVPTTFSLYNERAFAQIDLGTNIRQLNVNFTSMKINNDHDPLFPGEWKIDSYVNGQRTQLWIASELGRVDTGQTVHFREKDVNVTIPASGTLRIVTVGVEFDIDSQDNLPNIAGILDNATQMKPGIL